MPDITDRIKQLATQIYGEGEYTVEDTKVEALLKNAAGKILYRAAMMKPKSLGGSHLEALERQLSRRIGSA